MKRFRADIQAHCGYLLDSEYTLVQEVGWDSPKPGYDGLVDIAKKLLLQYRSGEETERATVLLCHLWQLNRVFANTFIQG